MRQYPPTLPPVRAWRDLVDLALSEDLRSGDITTEIVLPGDRPARADLEARQKLCVCGLPVAQAVFSQLDPRLRFEARVAEGERVAEGTVLATLEGSLHAILAGERTALNFLGRLCGVATLTARLVDQVSGTGVSLVDTRKTLPGWRVLDKYAVRVGGGVNHRMGLDDAILIKDNHIAAAGDVGLAVKSARAGAPPHLHLQVEVESLEAAQAAIEAGADSLLLDNRTPAELREITAALGDRVLLEASGGIREDNLIDFARTGVQRISLGLLTHSAPNADVALELRDGAAGGVEA